MDSEGPDHKKESFDTIECLSGEQMPVWDFTHVQDEMNSHILRKLKGTFSLDVAQILIWAKLFIANDIIS